MRGVALDDGERVGPGQAEATPGAPGAAGTSAIETTRHGERCGRTRLVVVTGLPRSGTSMAMRMLGAGGIPLVDDGRRAPSPANPHGWFEDERVRRLREDASWLRGVVGSAVKIVLPLVSAIPVDLPCDFVWMRRPILEVLASQRRMLGVGTSPGARRGVSGPNAVSAADPGEDALLARAFDRAVAEFAGRRIAGWRVVDLDYATALAAPAHAAEVLAGLVGEPFDRAAAARAVDPPRGHSSGR